MKFHVQPALPPDDYVAREFAEDGGLMSYGASIQAPCVRAGTTWAAFSKVEKPADLPIVQPTKFQFVINASGEDFRHRYSAVDPGASHRDH